MAWPTIHELVDHAGIDVSDAAAAARAQAALDAAVSLVKSEAHQDIDVVTETVALSGVWGSELWLPEVPVTAVTSVSITHAPLPAQVLGTSTYSWTPSGRLLSRYTYAGSVLADDSYSWGGPTAVVTVNYTHGWADSFVKEWALLRTLVLDVAGRRFQSPAEGFLVSDQVGDKAVTFARPSSAPSTAGVLTREEARTARFFRPPSR